MAGNSFGKLFRVTTAGVSHGPGYVCVVDGCPPGMPLEISDLPFVEFICQCANHSISWLKPRIVQ